MYCGRYKPRREIAERRLREPASAQTFDASLGRRRAYFSRSKSSNPELHINELPFIGPKPICGSIKGTARRSMSKAERRKERIHGARMHLKPTKERARLAATSILEYGYVKNVLYRGMIHIKYRVQLSSNTSFDDFQKLVYKAMKEGRISTDFMSNLEVSKFVETEEASTMLIVTQAKPVGFSPEYLNDMQYLCAITKAILDGGYSKLRIVDGKTIKSRYKPELAPGANINQLHDLVLLALVKKQISGPIISNEETRTFVDRAVDKGVLVTKMVEQTERK